MFTTSSAYTEKKLKTLTMAQSNSNIFVFFDITMVCRRIQAHLLLKKFVGLSQKSEPVHHKNFFYLKQCLRAFRKNTSVSFSSHLSRLKYKKIIQLTASASFSTGAVNDMKVKVKKLPNLKPFWL